MLARPARHPGANFPAVVGHEEVLLAVLATRSNALGRADRHLGREPARPWAGRDVDAQLVRLAGPDVRKGHVRIHLFGLVIAAQYRDQLVRVSP